MKEVILSALLAGAISGGGTYAVARLLRPPPVANDRPVASPDLIAMTPAQGAFLAGIKQLNDQVAAVIEIQKATLKVVEAGASSQLNQAVMLDEHVLQIACLIKGCKPQAMR